MVAIPLYVRHTIQYTASGGKFELIVGPRQTMGKTIEDVVIRAPMPKQVLNLILTPLQGHYMFDPVSKVLYTRIHILMSSKHS